MDRSKRKLTGAALLVLGAATIFIAMNLENRSAQQQIERSLAANDAWAREHPGQSRGVDIPNTNSFLILECFGGLLMLAGALVLVGRFGGKKLPTPPASGGITSS